MKPLHDYKAIFEASKVYPAFQKKVMELASKPRPRDTPYVPPLVVFTNQELAKKCGLPETSFNRLLDRNGVKADIRVGSRMAFSKPLADQIQLWSNAVICSTSALQISRYDGTSAIGYGGEGVTPEQAANFQAVSQRLAERAAEHLAKIISRQSTPTPKK